MGFLDNTGDIILDVVLTDHGRKALSRGDGSFKIDRFALGDEEINYELYDSSHASGSSYYDLQILQTPILEAFTDNAASMKTKLVTYENLDLLFLPVLELNVLNTTTQQESTKGVHIVAVDVFTEDDGEAGTENGIGVDSNGVNVPGVLYGESITKGGTIMVDQGWDTTEVSTKTSLPADLLETSYTIQIDNRFGSIVDRNGNSLTLSYIDDDNIAYYIVSTAEMETDAVSNISNLTKTTDSPIDGPRGSRLEFKIKSSMDLQTSSFLFTKLGGTSTMINKKDGVDTSDLYHIDSIVRVSGMNTGYSLDIPVRFVKLQ